MSLEDVSVKEEGGQGCRRDPIAERVGSGAHWLPIKEKDLGVPSQPPPKGMSRRKQRNPQQLISDCEGSTASENGGCLEERDLGGPGDFWQVPSEWGMEGGTVGKCAGGGLCQLGGSRGGQEKRPKLQFHSFFPKKS